MLHTSFTPNLKRIEIEITTACNLHCLNCDRSSRQAPSSEHMSVGQIRKFVEESLKLEWEWEEIRLIGGEPTLHPKLHDIFSVLKGYKATHPNCRISIHTNGYAEHVQKTIKGLPEWVVVVDSAKTSSVNLFSSYNVAPIDAREYEHADFSTGCWIPENCGIGLTRYGYYPCGAGASVDRVFGFNVGLKTLSDVKIFSLRNRMKILCSYCGHFKDTDYSKMNCKESWITEEKMSPVWEKAYQNYKRQKPELTLY